MKQSEKGQISLCHDHSIELTYNVFKAFIFIKVSFMSQTYQIYGFESPTCC